MNPGSALDEVVAGLAGTPRRLAAAIADLASREPGAPADVDPEADRETAGDRWSVAAVVLHLAAVDEEVWSPRLRQLEREAHPAWEWTEPDMPGRTVPAVATALAAFEAARASLLEAAAVLDAGARARTGTHAVFGELDAAGLLREALAHDAEHLADLLARVRDAARA